MRLFLASLGITIKLAPSFKLLLEESRHSRTTPKGYIIENASDYKGREKQFKLHQYYEILKNYGLDYDFLALKRYKNQASTLKAKLDSADFIYISGGNIFYLYYYVLESGLDKIIKDQIEKGLVYAASSAGSVIAGPTLKYLNLVDDLKISPEPDKIKWEGLKLIDFVILPHWGEEKYQSQFNIVKKNLENDGFKVKTLTNKQALSISNGNVELIEE